ncbi:sn-glycerol-3-phosphate ABC transporter substrate-binding protein UgpB [Roseococcus pinisoli]|uniref:sn-glycerol-3-phosphate-binding periplasmic protein UgpB n=1 Tax=Roseococcus pinisoli TaxID=2835040 RepID=A0ABS5QCT7_9PROT|nr:sn-glycerol-3-phosphate ABC transporter substrate-binding protein UgpB [Roseococcus pinisoli]MBS7810408.1 sn-glycerol-3-phosphate ABC transporter substrate-binding protein UgpB [Roseococcus pinisoli]
MLRRSFGQAAIAAAALPLAAPALAQGGPLELQFWHGLPQPLGGLLEKIVADFNASQTAVKIAPSFRGSYPETMVAAIAAFRANQAPHIVQMFEVGTGTMMAAGRAVKPVYELLAETGVQIDFNDFLPGVRGYYAAADGRQMSMPFNSSTSVVFYNKDMFRRANLNPDQFPTTWEGVEQAMRALKAAGIEAPLTTSWPTWLNLEQFSAIHDIPFATLANGFAGLGTELRINNPLVLKHMANLQNWSREGLYRYGGRDNAADALFPSGQVAITMSSSGLRARISNEARFQWGVGMLPYFDGTPRAPGNSIIGGASFWTMNKGPRDTRSAAEYRGVAEFYKYISGTEVGAKWHTDTGYLPLTRASFEAVKKTDYYQRNPGADVPIEQMLRGTTSDNTRGLRLGGLIEIRNIIQEEMEKMLQGQQSAEQAMAAGTTRGNVVLRNFERANRG